MNNKKANEKRNNAMNAFIVKNDRFEKDQQKEYYRGVGRKIKIARDESGMTLSTLAAMVNFTSAAIANYESGSRQVPIHILMELSDILNKPLHYFLGPEADSAFMITKALKSSIEKFSDAVYIKNFYKLEDEKLHELDIPSPMIPVPPFIAKDHHFALVIYNEKSETYSYYLCKVYKAALKPVKFPGKTKAKTYPPDPDTLVIASIGNSDKLELTSFSNITPAESYKETKNDIYNKYTVNIVAVVISRIERMVK